LCFFCFAEMLTSRALRMTLTRCVVRLMSTRPVEDYGKFITKVSARREPSAIRAIQPLTLLPGMISLGGGYPNVATFPFDSLSVSIRGVKGGSVLELRGPELERALQYTNTVCCQIYFSHPPPPPTLLPFSSLNASCRRGSSRCYRSWKRFSSVFIILLRSRSDAPSASPGMFFFSSGLLYKRFNESYVW
jgi:hypothetical protein